MSGLSLTAEDVVLGYPGRTAVLSGLRLEVRAGELLVVVGPSGCGKSTLLRAFAGLLPVAGGRLLAGTSPITGTSSDRALVFQDDALLPWRSVRSNVELPLAIRRLPGWPPRRGRRSSDRSGGRLSRTERRTKAVEWLARVGLADHQDKLPRELSGGMRQRAQLARTLAVEPRAILMDEPFGALDAQSRADMQRLLLDIRQAAPTTVVFVTHDVDEALILGDRVAVLGQGGLTALLESPGPGMRDHLLGCLGAATDLGHQPALERT